MSSTPALDVINAFLKVMESNNIDQAVQFVADDLVYINVAFGFEARADVFFGVAFQLNADAHDAFFMTKQSFRFLLHKGLERRSQLEMNAGDDELVGIWAVHNP